MSEVLVIAETTAAGVRKPTLELLTAARALGEPAAVVFGEASDAVVAQLGEYGATNNANEKKSKEKENTQKWKKE